MQSKLLSLPQMLQQSEAKLHWYKAKLEILAYFFIRNILVVNIVKAELMFLDIFCQINFLPK